MVPSGLRVSYVCVCVCGLSFWCVFQPGSLRSLPFSYPTGMFRRIAVGVIGEFKAFFFVLYCNTDEVGVKIVLRIDISNNN